MVVDDMTQLQQIKQNFVEGMSGISQFWGFPKGVGAIFGVLYLSPRPLSLDELVTQTGLTKGAISTNVRALARMGLVHPVNRLSDRKDYYESETDFYKAIRAILKERQNNEFDRAVASVRETLEKLESGTGDDAERAFLTERVRALKDFFDALDALTNAVSRLDSLGLKTVQTVLKTLK
jgi:HTH-type transcriptional regulator, glycine betaine synthesis regulator